MAGKEVSGIAGADADLFVGCTYCLTVQHLANPNALGLLTSLIGTLGAEPFFVDAVEHDSFASAISHLPFLLSIALVRSTSSSPSWRDLKRLAASGYRDVSRLASADPTMHRDICLSNREQLLHWLDAFGSALAEMTAMIRNGSPDLEGVFQSAKETRDEWLAERSRAADR